MVYDVDVVQGALQRFARFFNRIPLSLQVQIIGLLIREVLVRKDGIDVQTHELAISDFQRALGGKKEVAFGPHQTLRRREANATDASTHPQPVKGTAVVNLGINWRGRHGHKTTDDFPEPVPTQEKVYIFPAFSLNWLIAWDRIKNGELVVTETISSCGQKTTDFDVPEFKSHRALPGWSGVIPPASNLRPDRAARGYAQP